MGLLDTLLGGGSQRQHYQDFVQRYEQGRPWEGVSDEEATQHYSTVAQHLGPQDYRVAAEEAVSRLSPDERAELAEHLRQRARQQDVNFPGLHETPNLEQPGVLASVMSAMHGEQPGILRQLLGGSSGGGTGAQSNVAKAALAGIAAIGLKKVLGGKSPF
jgi:hypothetical protein